MKIVEVPLQGHLTQPALAVALGPAGSELGSGPCAMMIDCLEMEDYDADARRAFVEWHKAHKAQVGAVAILTRKASWHLVISAMALASGQKMKPFGDRQAAETWLRSLG